jgi:hypothetical protein
MAVGGMCSTHPAFLCSPVLLFTPQVGSPHIKVAAIVGAIARHPLWLRSPRRRTRTTGSPSEGVARTQSRTGGTRQGYTGSSEYCLSWEDLFR